MPVRSVLTSLALAALYCGALVIGRATVPPGVGVGLLWPAAGVLILWFGVQWRARTRVLDVGLVVVTSVAVYLVDGVGLLLAEVHTAVILLQLAVFLVLALRWCPHLCYVGGKQSMTTVGDLTSVAVAALLAAVVGGSLTLVAVAALSAEGTPWSQLALLITRNTLGQLLVVVPGARIFWRTCRPGAAGPSGQQPGAAAAGCGVRPTGWRLVELVLVLGASVSAYLLVFVVFIRVPLGIFLLATTVWIAIRFATPLVLVHDVTVGSLAITLTLHGHGPFLTVSDPVLRALVVQAFVGLVALVGTYLALSREERDVLLAETTAHAAQAQAVHRASRALLISEDPRTAVCEAVLEVTGADGAYLFEPDGRGHLLSSTVVGRGLPPLALDLTSEGSLTVSAFLDRRHRFARDARRDPNVTSKLAGLVGATSAACQPVTAGDRALGVIALVWHQPAEPLPDHVTALLETLAAEAAVAIEREDLLARLARAASHDDLTGLPNRRLWDETAGKEIARAQRGSTSLSFLLLDLDHFKRYNDTRGHLQGDVLLQEFAASAGSCLRDVDTLARWGGEEFVVALPSCTTDDAVAVADRIRASVPHGQTCTVGVAAWEPGLTSAEVLARADTALYRGKEAGRDRVVVSSGSTPPVVLPTRSASVDGRRGDVLPAGLAR